MLYIVSIALYSLVVLVLVIKVWVDKHTSDDLKERLANVRESRDKAEEELQKYLPKKEKKECIKCHVLTEYIPENNTKYCSSCQWTIQQTK